MYCIIHSEIKYCCCFCCCCCCCKSWLPIMASTVYETEISVVTKTKSVSKKTRLQFWHQKIQYRDARRVGSSLEKSSIFQAFFSIIGDSQFNNANTSRRNFLKKKKPQQERSDSSNNVYAVADKESRCQTLRTRWACWHWLDPPTRKQPDFLSVCSLESEVVKPAGFKRHMFVSRETRIGEKYLQMGKECGAVLATKNNQGGLGDKESNGKMFERPRSKRCRVRLIQKYLSHLNPDCSALLQKPWSPCKSFNPARNAVWYCWTLLGHNTLDNMPRSMTTRVGRIPNFLTNNTIRATTVTVVSAANITIRHITAINGHQSEASFQIARVTVKFEQFKTMWI